MGQLWLTVVKVKGRESSRTNCSALNVEGFKGEQEGDEFCMPLRKLCMKRSQFSGLLDVLCTVIRGYVLIRTTICVSSDRHSQHEKTEAKCSGHQHASCSVASNRNIGLPLTRQK